MGRVDPLLVSDGIHGAFKPISVLEVSTLLDEVKANDAVKAVIVTGAGEKAFSAGADIAFLNRASPLEVRELARTAVAVNAKIEALGKVVVAAVNGYALGGGPDLILAADRGGRLEPGLLGDRA